MEGAVGVIMRVPGLFIIDYWWQHDRNKSLPHSMELGEILNCVATNLVLLHGFLLLLLPLRHVRALYTHFISAALIVSCHMVSGYYIEMEMKKAENDSYDPYFLRRQIAMFLFHGLLGGLISYLLKGPWISVPPVFSVYAIPVIARLANLPVDALPFFHNFCRAVTGFNVFLYITYQIPDILDCAKLAYMDALTVTEAYGVTTLFTLLWNKLFVPTHFALFWLIEFWVKLVGSIYQVEKLGWGDEWYIIILTTISSICASPVTLVAVSISYLSFFTLCSTRAYLLGLSAFFHDNPMHSGWTEGLTLILLSIQTGLIEMKMPSRMAVMTIILFIVLSSLLQSMLEIAEPVVLALSASRSRSIWRHFRALSLCFTLLVFPLYLTKVLSAIFPIDFWMMVVLSSCTLTSVQVLDLLLVHSLFLYDSARSEPWESLDDTVYYTRAITKVLEFFVAIFVVGMGLWESTSGKWNWVNASILLVHCYFNVWQRLQTGWRSFLLRREAAKKAKSLPSATEEQLALLDDVCSICFGSMSSACVTPCQHYFHRTCLRKWLYVQDKCPLCHGVISLPTSMENNNVPPAAEDSQRNDGIRPAL
ncbi:RING finger protein 145-like isoform X1 [Stegodyphus dumicola]|uniref:RING finger protein 145-like isoform X1 n=2 Tax=Stegodyphus dumicola TaxID=202533 RepID=UPI0015AA7E9F|nr:RING finger protein 145-like isoform X1 [Stegodyphus dumicola]XP_035231978.1 RING finger protein 145-like isoform X1 [Stegodyphus dumicola]XP_035231979.1 RING finger protein 145-like isoform X1 [Stegodyphus dumicola]XP_035231980.1 RING finger protein 145-like isoform X1 [Stegodyphus dumicola]